MVQTKKTVLEVEIEIDVPEDIVQDKGRIKPFGKSFAFELMRAGLRNMRFTCLMELKPLKLWLQGRVAGHLR